MVFSSITFLYFFLPVALVLYFFSPKVLRNYVLLVLSLAFFAWGAPKFLFVLIGSCLLDFLVSRKLSPGAISNGKRKLFLFLIIALNLGLLGYFKYANFVVDQLYRIYDLLNVSKFAWEEVILPIGISFFTFQKISYLVDVYRGEVEPSRSPIDHLLYISLFPQLIAGPIVRYHDVAEQIRERKTDTHTFLDGLWRFSLGLFKKVIIANCFARVADAMFNATYELTTAEAWVGALAYTFQLYFDFSGYSDMAIGLGRIFGFRFLENFRFPYISRSITEFWRRWHISLGRFMMEYLYIPLGGNKKGSFCTMRNLWLVFLFSGFWHGASWNFIIWGAWHGFWISFERFIGKERLAKIPQILSIPFTFFIVVIGWVVFRSPGTINSLKIFKPMFGMGAVESNRNILPEIFSNTYFIAITILAVIFAFAPLFFKRARILADKKDSEVLTDSEVAPMWKETLCFGASLAILIVSTMELCATSFNPFIYFQF